MTPTQEHKTPAEVLNAAADLIEPEGAWITGALERSGDDGKPFCWCAQGAIREAAGPDDDSFYDAMRALEDVLPQRRNDTMLNRVAHWNDHVAKNQAEVVAALREAARRAEGRS